MTPPGRSYRGKNEISQHTKKGEKKKKKGKGREISGEELKEG